MSGRMVKRLLKSQEKLVDLQGTSSDVDEDESSEQEEDGHKSAPAMNPFDLLNEEEFDEEVEEDSEEHFAEVVSLPIKVEKPSKAGKKKKGNSKGKAKASSGHGATPPASTRSDDELLDLLAQAKSADVSDRRAPDGEKASGKAGTSHPATCVSILGVDSKHLKAEDELRRIFGAKVISQVERDRDEDGGGPAAGFAGLRRRLGGAGVRRGGARAAGALRKCHLITPMEHWPRVEEGLSMECVGTGDGVTRFRYMHSEAYAAVQRKYESCVSSHDPNTIAELLAHHPYHVDSLLTLSDFYRHMGEHQTAADLVDRCLFALECAWHPWFNPEHGTCRLDYSWEPNRAFFRVLFRHMQHLGRRGCHRTALEICKLLLALDPDDPLGVTFCIDYFALRSEQYDWLGAFVDSHGGGGHSLAVFPNFAFSLALSAFRKEQRRRDSGRKASSSQEEPPAVAAATGVPAAELLEQALMLHPAVLSKIVEKAPVKVDSEWQKILKHKVFASSQAGGPSLEHLLEIYIERQHLLWRGSDVQAWLKAAAKAVIASYDSSKGRAMEDWACVRLQAFPSTSNEYRHLHISEFSNNVAALPAEELDGGARPPPAQGAPNPADYQLRDHNTLMALLESMLPWVDLGVDLQGQEAPHLPEEGDGGGHGN